MRISATLTLALFASGAQANAIGAGTVIRIGGTFSTPTAVYFGISPLLNNRAACNTNGSYQFVFDPSTTAGKALYSALPTAKTTERPIPVYGSGTCILGQAMEGVGYWILDP